MKAELDIVWAEACKLLAEGDKLWAKGHKLLAEGDRLRAEGDKLWTEGHKLWLVAIYRICGSGVSVEWPAGGSCIVAGVMEFLPV